MAHTLLSQLKLFSLARTLSWTTSEWQHNSESASKHTMSTINLRTIELYVEGVEFTTVFYEIWHFKLISSTESDSHFVSHQVCHELIRVTIAKLFLKLKTWEFLRGKIRCEKKMFQKDSLTLCINNSKLLVQFRDSPDSFHILLFHVRIYVVHTYKQLRKVYSGFSGLPFSNLKTHFTQKYYVQC